MVGQERSAREIIGLRRDANKSRQSVRGALVPPLGRFKTLLRETFAPQVFARRPTRIYGPMKAMVLAAGEGTRLRPYTLAKPKPMIEIAGAPILEHNVRLLAKHGVAEIVINVCHVPEAITDYFGDGSRFGVSIRYSYEDRPLGTAGALKRVKHLFTEDFLLVYGDNLSTCNVTGLMELHRSKSAKVTLALFERENPQAGGIVDINADDRIVRFLEKPRTDQVFSHWVNAGIMAVHPSALSAIPQQMPSDFSRDVLEHMVARGDRVYGYRMRDGLWWIDSLEDYERTRRYFSEPAVAEVLRKALAN
jgi:mannose-1-phosphate guanylyltransferase/phosphomannomutase